MRSRILGLGDLDQQPGAGWNTGSRGTPACATGWNIHETLTFYRLPRIHHKHMKSTNMLERLNEEIRRRTRVGADLPQHQQLSTPGASPGRGDPRRLAGGLAGGNHYLNMELLKEHKMILLRQAEAACAKRTNPAWPTRFCTT